MNTQRWKFLEGVFLSNAIASALGHSSTYAIKDEKGRETVRDALRSELCDLARKYACKVVGADAHVENIEELARRVSARCGSSLKCNRLRFGVAQKALNLYLKFLWCAGRIQDTPPHCPFDSTVIDTLRRNLREQNRLPSGWKNTWNKWTEVDDKDIYCEWVKAATIVAGNESLAEWELRVWPTKGCETV